MGSPLNKVPAGLLDFFGVKSGEWGPREIGQILAPTVELRDWYWNAYSLEVSFAQAALIANAGAGTIALTTPAPADFDLLSGGNIVVPQTELLLILEANASWAFQAVAGQRCELFWNFNQLSPPQPLIGYQTSDATVALSGTRSLDHPFWVTPGKTISLSHTGLAVAAGSVQPNFVRLRYLRFRI